MMNEDTTLYISLRTHTVNDVYISLRMLGLSRCTVNDDTTLVSECWVCHDVLNQEYKTEHVSSIPGVLPLFCLLSKN